MKSVQEVYPQDSTFFYVSDYTPLLESFELPILVRIDEQNYSGDSFVLFKDTNRYGVLIFGWGSCSGCDALQSCRSYEEVNALQTDLFNKIQWFDSARKLLEWLLNDDREYDYQARSKEWRQFIRECVFPLLGR